MFLKAVVYFVVVIQIDCVQCAPFLKFYDSVLFENLALVNHIGDGLAYRFNNFKIRALKEQTKEYSQLNKIIGGVKRLLSHKNWLQKQALIKSENTEEASALLDTEAEKEPLSEVEMSENQACGAKVYDLAEL